jgi:hypothetical protein
MCHAYAARVWGVAMRQNAAALKKQRTKKTSMAVWPYWLFSCAALIAARAR